MSNLQLPDRFWKKVDRSGGQDACWPWLAVTTSGYPVFNNPVDRLVRRYLWFLLHGELPRGFNVVCKLGRIDCVNPSHVVKQTREERTQMAIARGTFWSPFSNGDAEDRAEYALRAKETVDENQSRHIVTSEQRRKGHVTRGCTPGGTARSKRVCFDMTVAERRSVLRDPCVYCGSKATEVDHIQPYARGGSHDAMNRAPTCLPCNRAKNDISLLLFLIKRRRAEANGTLTAASGLTYAGH